MAVSVIPTLDLERAIAEQGYDVIVGFDEVGRGSLAYYIWSLPYHRGRYRYRLSFADEIVGQTGNNTPHLHLRCL